MNPPRLIVITDLDGTLLDQESYCYDASLPAIQRLLSLKIPLVLCSSKTRVEILPLWEELGLHDPFIVENGGAIYFPVGYFPMPVRGARSRGSLEALELGRDVCVLREALAETAYQCGAEVKSFGGMGLDEISALTGLHREQAELAAMREYDEPFVVKEGDREKLHDALKAKGFTIIQGDRFSHVTGGNDKGKAVRVLLNLYRSGDRSVLSVGLGNSANDLPFLCQVDRPVVVRNPDGSWDAEVVSKIPAVQCTQGIGPYGWKEAIHSILASVGIPNPG
ncbi:MAG: HAD-IIB family hydrolase [Candidatus Binatia bacterium]